ncbi:MAG: type II toxin-antitoxin system HicA family toxin [Candidatus Paceibacterota bacterium]
MPNLKRLSGKEIIKELEALGFVVVRQKGSHIRLSRVNINETQNISIPNHDELDRGTQKAIIRALKPFLTLEEINNIFYTE